MGRQSHFYPNLPLLLGLQSYFWTAYARPGSINNQSIYMYRIVLNKVYLRYNLYKIRHNLNKDN